jgi:hypothetical protein
MRSASLFVCCLSAALLAGCAELLPGSGLSAVDAAAGEALNVSRAPAFEQKAALARAQESFLKDASVANRLRLATLLAVLPAPLRDDARAAELLEPVADAGAPGAGRYAALLSLQVRERQRLARELERLARERERADRERAAMDKERTERDRERDKREEALKQQLDALRAIERGVLEREDRLRRRQR